MVKQSKLDVAGKLIDYLDNEERSIKPEFRGNYFVSQRLRRKMKYEFERALERFLEKIGEENSPPYSRFKLTKSERERALMRRGWNAALNEIEAGKSVEELRGTYQEGP